MFTQLKERARRTVAALTAAALLAGTAVLGLVAPAAAADSSGAPLVWGVESTFRSHFKPFTTASAGASKLEDGSYSYPYGTSTVSGGVGVAQFTGSIDVFAYGGMYTAQFQSPKVTLTSPTSGILSVTSNGVEIQVASFVTSVPAESGGTLHYTATNVTLLASGIPLFGNTYPAGQVFDDFTFGIPAPVVVLPTTTTLGLPATAKVRESATFTVTVAPAVNGTVGFSVNGTEIGTATAVAGVASFSYTPSVAGEFSVKAQFTSADNKYAASSSTQTLQVAALEPAPVDRVVTVTGSGFTDLPKTASGSPAMGAYVAVVEAGTDIATITVSNGFASDWVMPNQIVNGAFTKILTVPAAHAGKNLEVVSWSAHGMANAATLIDRKPVTSSDTVALSYSAGGTEEPETPVDPGTDRVVTVTGSGFTDLPNNSTGKAASGAYVAVVEAGTDITTITMRNALAVSFVPNASIINGAFTQTLKVPAAHAGKNLEVVAWSAHGNPSAATLIDRKPVTASNTVALKYAAGGTEEPETPVDPEVPTTPEAPEAQAGSLQWGVKKSFREYLQMPMSGGQIILSGAAQNADGSVYAFPQASSNFAGSTGTVRYSGSVRFTGHEGALDTKLDKPYVVVTGPTSGELYATVSAKHMTDPTKAVFNKVLKVADLTFGKPSVNADGSYTFKTTKVLLAAAGVAAFSDFYKVGAVLDNLTFIAGSNSTQGGGATGSTDGFSATVSASTVTAGQTLTLTGRGFTPNATGINAYLYSNPVLLAQNLKANAQGVVTAKVTIPANTAAGQHTLSLEVGTDKAQVAVTVKAASTGGLPTLDGDDDNTSTGTDGTDATETDKEPVCVARAVSGASLNWGLRSSYIRYVDNLSDGVVSATGSVRRAGSTFAWSGGSGKYNVDANKGLVYFGGKLHFAGHDDAMNSTFSNIRIQFASSGTAYVLADVVAKGLDTPGLTKNGAHIATVSLSGNKSASGSKITWTNAPVTLTSTGAAAFGGFYEAGESLDSMTISVPLGATTDCDAGSGTLAATGAEEGTSAAALSALALMFAGLALVAVRRNRFSTTAR